jgi:hypothetical protein
MNTKFAVCEARLAERVPVVVTGEPVTEKMLGSERATLVTDPLPKEEVLLVTNAVVATVVSLLVPAAVVAVAVDPRATVEEKVTAPDRVLAPVIVCVPLSDTNAPSPPMAAMLVAVPLLSPLP